MVGAVLWLLAAAGLAPASEIYKSIDANGNVVYSDQRDPSMSQSTVQLDDPLFPPHVLHFCWTNCFTLVLDNGIYRRIDGTDESWTVETFSANTVVLHRHDPPREGKGNSSDVVYAGQVSNDRLIGVTVNGNAVAGIDASWGAALNTLPGSNAERDAKSTANLNGPNSANLNPPPSVTVSSAATPPPLPMEDQPVLSQDGSLWTPGYWYWGDQGYVWVPGAWVRPPQVGVLWTPAYWGFAGTVYVFHPGHWGSTVGFYGGVNYGYGYFGSGYTGGHWIGNSFAYNSTVNHVNPAVAQHLYAESVPNQGSRGSVSYTGGPSSGDATRTASQQQSLQQQSLQQQSLRQQSQPRAVNNPATPATVQRTTETAPLPMEANKPAAAVKTPAPSATPKFNHVTSTQTAAPTKQ
jgi:hypothetical protein